MSEKTTNSSSVWVVGASRGIGAHIAALESLENPTLCISRSGNVPADGNPSNITALACDVLADQNVATIANYCKTHTPSIQRLYLNVGGGSIAPFATQSIADFEQTVAINLFSQTRVLRAVLPYLADGANVVSVNSVAGVQAFGGWSAYSAAKAGLRSFMDAFRQEVGTKYRVMSAFPYATDTDFWDSVDGEWDRTQMMQASEAAKTIVDAANAAVTIREIQFASPHGVL